MSDTTNTTTPNAEHVGTGYKVVNYALDVLAWGVTVAVAFSCSSILMGIIMAIIMAIVMALLCALAQLLIAFKVPVTSIETLGRHATNVTARVTGLFNRKEAAAA